MNTTTATTSSDDPKETADASITRQEDATNDISCDIALDGGHRAWLVVLSGFLVYFATFGFLNTYGTFQAYYQDQILSSTSISDISWIGSIEVFVLFISGLFIGPLFDMWGGPALVIPGSIMYVLSLMFTSLSRQYYQFLLSQGVLFGVGFAMLFYPTMGAVSQWFDKRRGLALGITVSGSSLGGICWPLLLQHLFRAVGFPWAMRIAGFMCLGLLLPSWWLLTARVTRQSSSTSAHESDSPRESIWHFLLRLLGDANYTVFSLGMFFVLWGMFIPFGYLPIYARHYGMNDDAANNLVAYLNAGSLVSRIASGYAADHFGRFNTNIFCALACGILIFCLYAITTPGAIIAFSVLYGVFSGGIISLQTACVAQITQDPREIGARIGLMMAICSFGGLTGNPIAGALISRRHGGFEDFIAFSASVLTAGGGLVLLSRLIAAPGKARF